jgi:voltage-gated potassium channel
MISGYAIIAVPTGIVTGEIVKKNIGKKPQVNPLCPECSTQILNDQAKFCSNCGTNLKSEALTS